MESAFGMAGDDNKCPKCEKGEAILDHTCPYAEEINEDCESVCDCCEDCIRNCANDI
jgi:hypothetical protein